MKKALFLSLALVIGGGVGFSQTRTQVVKNQEKKIGTANVHKMAQGKYDAPQAYQFAPSAGVPSTRYGAYDEFETMISMYDLQANGYVANRMWRFDDGCVGITETWSQDASFADRGTGYNFYDGNDFGEQPSARIENEKTGWPSYAQYGPDGEIVVAHNGTGNLVYYTREHKGQGEWVGRSIPNPDLGVPAQEMTWPRVITSGPDHSIIHVIAADQDSEILADSYGYYARSTDGENWTVGFVPTLDETERKLFSSDYYALASNGNTVAILITGDIMGHTYVIKSNDNGETWEKMKVWDNPYAGLDWENDEASIFGEDNPMYGPSNGAICIDNGGMVHVALSSFEYFHEALGTSYNFYIGMAVDGIFYWNEEMFDGGPFVDNGWTCPDDGSTIAPNPHNALRMWWPTDASDTYITRDFSRPIVGFVDPEATASWSNDAFYYEDYKSYFMGCSALPAMCIDETGTIAIAFSAPDPMRDLSGTNQYFRSMYVSYIEAPYTPGDYYGEWTEEPGSFYYLEDKLLTDFMHALDECVAISSIQNTVNHEYWFSTSVDDLQGFGVGNSATQGQLTDNYLFAVKVVPEYPGLGVEEVVNPLTDVTVYPNPATTSTIYVNASQSAEAVVEFHNIAGQLVKTVNKTLSTGMNSINISELTSGVYFCTVSANGYSKTTKLIVK